MAMIGDRWNVTDDEVARSYPCDQFVATPTLQAWRGVTVRTTREVLWPWVAQIRLAPYSYDWIDNLGRRSPQKLMGACMSYVLMQQEQSTRLLMKLVTNAATG
jgi:hypothetical protein